MAITAGVVRECCRTGRALRIVEDTDTVTIRQCIEPAADGLLELDGVRVCGRRHFRAKLLGLDARAVGTGLGG